jgi:hypothetical protein
MIALLLTSRAGILVLPFLGNSFLTLTTVVSLLEELALRTLLL